MIEMSSIQDCKIQMFNEEYEEEIKCLIKHSKQQVQEPISDFISKIVELNLQLYDPFSDEEIISLLVSNVIPVMSLFLSPYVIRDLETFQKEAQRLHALGIGSFPLALQIPIQHLVQKGEYLTGIPTVENLVRNSTVENGQKKNKLQDLLQKVQDKEQEIEMLKQKNRALEKVIYEFKTKEEITTGHRLGLFNGQKEPGSLNKKIVSKERVKDNLHCAAPVQTKSVNIMLQDKKEPQQTQGSFSLLCNHSNNVSIPEHRTVKFGKTNRKEPGIEPIDKEDSQQGNNKLSLNYTGCYRCNSFFHRVKNCPQPRTVSPWKGQIPGTKTGSMKVQSGRKLALTFESIGRTGSVRELQC